MLPEASSAQQAALIAKLNTEDAYYAAWEARLRRLEEENRSLWRLTDDLISLCGASVTRLEKLERRVGYHVLRLPAKA
ncbi:MAG: hypothetical protein HC933_15325 [Pleurocapsa sp. SU_196_0]|nr:hypothetical protein [Pleurocapsa sp. SU_196_0]